MDQGSEPRKLRRREALVAAGAAGLGLVWTNGSGWIDAAGVAVEEDAVAAASCTLSKELTEGPYWIDNNLTRRNVTAGRRGVPLTLLLTVEDSDTCKVIKGADVEIWHADRKGAYSGVGSAGSSSRFLRGHQKTNAKGVARFETIYPGWYQGRSPHIHLKVHVGGGEVFTGQLFFKDSVSRAVYRSRLYRGPRPGLHDQRRGQHLRERLAAAPDEAEEQARLHRAQDAGCERLTVAQAARPRSAAGGRARASTDSHTAVTWSVHSQPSHTRASV